MYHWNSFICYSPKKVSKRPTRFKQNYTCRKWNPNFSGLGPYKYLLGFLERKRNVISYDQTRYRIKKRRKGTPRLEDAEALGTSDADHHRGPHPCWGQRNAGAEPIHRGTAGLSNVAKPETELMGGQTTSGTYLPCMADLQAQQVWEKAFIFLLSTLSYKSC